MSKETISEARKQFRLWLGDREKKLSDTALRNIFEAVDDISDLISLSDEDEQGVLLMFVFCLAITNPYVQGEILNGKIGSLEDFCKFGMQKSPSEFLN